MSYLHDSQNLAHTCLLLAIYVSLLLTHVIVSPETILLCFVSLFVF